MKPVMNKKEFDARVKIAESMCNIAYNAAIPYMNDEQIKAFDLEITYEMYNALGIGRHNARRDDLQD